jgi:hypothetical protein
VWKAEAERRDCLAREKVAWEVAVAEEQWQSLSKGFWASHSPSRLLPALLVQHLVRRLSQRAMEEDSSASQYVLFIQLSFIADFLWRSKFPSCDSCTITGVPCLTELQKNRTRRTSCDQCWQWKMACHWDLVGVTGPQDPSASKQARRIIKKPVIDVDDLEDTGNGSLSSPAVDIVLLFGTWPTRWLRSRWPSGQCLSSFRTHLQGVLTG